MMKPLKDLKIIAYCEPNEAILSYEKFFRDFTFIGVVHDLDIFRRKIIEHKPDLLVIDFDGNNSELLEHCYEIRTLDSDNWYSMYAFIHSQDEYFELALYNAGFDDVIDKNTKPRLIIAKANALFNRKHHKQKNKTQQRRPLEIDKERYLVYINGNEKILPKKEFDLLSQLMSKPGKVFTREEIYNNLWKNGENASDRIIDVHIRKLREKIGEKYISTVKGVGYYIAI